MSACFSGRNRAIPRRDRRISREKRSTSGKFATLVFFRGVLQSGLVGNPSEEAGDELVGELAEAEMDLLLQSGKAGWILGELFSPALLLLLKLKVNFLKCLPSRRNGLARLGTKTEEHRPASLTLFSLLSFYARGGIGSTFWVGAQSRFASSTAS